ncbi:GGDEF domain-containing protein [Capillibacterium thermochitinicola]|uniref:GGDEF domain-containing protein n=1 Tax=Capillibacterium thermochitinicola TaxID=2699427 RepID=A0A8J6HTT9_9FIRM|nr:GGDEF domain-containing protein [Capillibacterium thermochitinicola]MBA2134136.1 GGDEF domain-containing protein [Capillibacterium thermochitinicola]
MAFRNYPAYFHKRIIDSGIFLFIGIIIQVVFPQYHTTWITTAFYLVLYYALSCEMSSLLDGLTGLLNRTAFNREIEHLKLSSKQNMVIYMIDVNDFKGINDTKGHTSGDYYLKEIGKILETVFSFNAKIYRFGGDEFSVILSRKPGDSMDYADKLVSLIKNRQGEDPDFPSVAVGCSNFEAGENAWETINMADNNMYKNKRAKGNRD